LTLTLLMVARCRRVRRPRLHDTVRPGEPSESFESVNEFRSPITNGVLMGPLRHRLRELPAHFGDVSASIVDAERDRVVVTVHGEPRPITSSSSFRTSCWKPAALEAGYTHTWHDLRNYYATRQLAADVGIQLVSQALGHSSPRITWDIYIGNDGSSVDASEAIWGN
jgi:integrase